MALTANSTWNAKNHEYFADFVVTSGVTIYKGAMVAMTIGTGTVTNYDDASNAHFIGYATEKVVGDGTLKIKLRLKGDLYLSATITGTTAATDNFAVVYATDESTFTLTRPSDDAQVIGVVFRWITSTTCDLMMFSVEGSTILALSGGNKRTLRIGDVDTRALEVTAATDLVTSYQMWGHGKIVDFYAYVDGYDASYAAGLQALNLEINATDVTGGVLTLYYTQCDGAADKGPRKTSTAITGTNEFHDGDYISVELATDGTAFSAGLAEGPVTFALYIDVEYMAGV